MRIEKTRVVPEKEEKYTAEILCDICGAKSPQHRWDPADWGEDCYDVEEVEIRYKTGSSYPEGVSGEEIFFDICPECFEEKVLPALAALGASPQEREWDH